MFVAQEVFSGIVDNVIFSSEDTGFTVAKVSAPKQEDPICIVGHLSGIIPGETIVCTGEWKHHPSYGRQFSVDSFQLEKPSDLVGIQKYLESGLVKGIGPVYAERIIDHFGVKTLEIIDNEPDRLKNIPGIGRKRIELIKQHWEDQRSIREVMIFLRTYDVPPSYAQKIYKAYGDKSIEIVTENPFALAKNIFGIGFKTADRIAEKLGIDHGAAVRIDAGIEHLLWELSSDGHVCYPQPDLIQKGAALLEVAEEEIEKRLTELEVEERIIRQELPNLEDFVNMVWVKPLYLAELGIARQLERLFGAPSTLRNIDVTKAIEWTQEKLQISFAEQQKEAVLKSFTEKLHIITGGPGTGKSTITKAILLIAQKLTEEIHLAAPTGRAAKRLSEITGKKAQTIHSLLEFSVGGFKKNAEDPLKCDLMIVDEASMIDTYLMNALLKALPDTCRIIFIGDIDQLPSVGPGNVLRDMIGSGCLPVTCLTEIFRQAQGSKIITNAHKVNQGVFPDIEHEKGSDFYFIESNSPEDILRKIEELIQVKLPNAFRLHPINDIQVLSPMKKGVIGIENLNVALQNTLNPSDKELLRMGRNFRISDKVMQIRNNYDKEVFNGDVGRITHIDSDENLLFVNFEGTEVEYEFSEIDELVLAYAVSVHKYQGSECPCVIMPVHTSHYKLLYRNLLYTGITRGRKLVILLGSKKALFMATKNNDVFKRYTGLKSMILEKISSVQAPIQASDSSSLFF